MTKQKGYMLIWLSVFLLSMASIIVSESNRYQRKTHHERYTRFALSLTEIQRGLARDFTSNCRANGGVMTALSPAQLKANGYITSYGLYNPGNHAIATSYIRPTTLISSVQSGGRVIADGSTEVVTVVTLNTDMQFKDMLEGFTSTDAIVSSSGLSITAKQSVDYYLEEHEKLANQIHTTGINCF